VSAFEDDLMILGLKTLFMKTKGFEYQGFEQEWLVELRNAQAMDAGAQRLEMTRTQWPIFISPANIQDGNWPSGFGNP
jgi:hypothetical protein